ncbi:MAG: hypothetical protein KA319_05755 [Ferruginibacter sp.]|nr:hypothetical protein [Ferruginibacter sp.]
MENSAATPKILFVHLYSNGDCLYATAIARQIKNDYSNAILTWAVAGFCKEIIKNNPYVDNMLVVDDVLKNDVNAFRKFKKKIIAEERAGKWDKVFITHNMDTNLALYDGTIRGMILRAYPTKVTIPLQPILQLTKTELDNVAFFANKNKLSSYKNVILWEYAPLSGQVALNFDMVMAVAKRITAQPSTCVILSSANKFTSTATIIDASVLKVRENAALTHYCTLLIGCSSGITWLTTSSAAKFLPMVQLLNAKAAFRNLPSIDFKRYSIEHNGLIELFSFGEEKVFSCLQQILTQGFSSAINYNENPPQQFNTTQNIIYNLFVYGEFGAIKKHLKIMKSMYGLSSGLLKAILVGFISIPFKLIRNIWKKKVVKA